MLQFIRDNSTIIISAVETIVLPVVGSVVCAIFYHFNTVSRLNKNHSDEIIRTNKENNEKIVELNKTHHDKIIDIGNTVIFIETDIDNTTLRGSRYFSIQDIGRIQKSIEKIEYCIKQLCRYKGIDLDQIDVDKKEDETV